MEKVTILGAGLMGHGLAQVFARAGHDVCMYSRKQATLDKGLAGIRSQLELMAKYGIGTVEEIDGIVARVSITTDLEESVKGADYVFESVAEDLGIKQNIFSQIDKICPLSTILATNTSVKSITEIASTSEHRERIVGTHFWNPPHLIPLVEVVPGDDTKSETVDKMYDLLQAAGKHPIKVKKDVPGFVANRLQHALWREAISIIENGIADAATVDESIKYSFGMRLPQLGPIENADMVGTDLTLQIHSYILDKIEDSHKPSKMLEDLVAKGDLGFKSGKGFQEWTPEQAEERGRLLQEYLLKVTKASME